VHVKKDLVLPKKCRIKQKANFNVKGIGYKGIIKPTSPGITTMPVGTDPPAKNLSLISMLLTSMRSQQY